MIGVSEESRSAWSRLDARLVAAVVSALVGVGIALAPARILDVPLVLACIVGAGVLAWAVVDRSVALLLIGVALPFERYGLLPLSGIAFRPYQITVMLLMIAVLIRPSSRRFRPSVVFLGVAAFYVSTVISAGLALTPGDLRFLFGYLFFVGMVAAIEMALVTERHLLLASIGVALGGALAAGFALFQFVGIALGIDTGVVITGMGIRDGSAIAPRLNSMFFDPDQYSGYLAFTIPVVVALVAATRGVIARATFGAIAAVMVLTLLGTLARGGIFATIAAGLVVLPLAAGSVRRTGRLLALTVLAVGVIALVVPYVSNQAIDLELLVRRYSDFSEFDPGRGRYLLAQVSFAGLFSSPLSVVFGVGPAEITRWETVFPGITSLDFTFRDGRLSATNSFLDMLVGGGLVGLVALVSALGLGILAGWRSLRELPAGPARTLTLGWIGALAGAAVFAFSNSALTYPNIWVPLAVLGAIDHLRTSGARLIGETPRPSQIDGNPGIEAYGSYH